MLQLKNNTPFDAALAIFPNEKGIETLYVTLKATISIGDKLDLARRQMPVVLADEYWGEPESSSLRYASEFHLSKPATDIVLIGDACVPDRRNVTSTEVTLSVGTICKTIIVMGNRQWERGVGGMFKSSPEPFEEMPLRYENAFGGSHVVNAEEQETLYEERNPVGCGFRGKRKWKALDGLRLPNLEDPENLIQKPSDRPIPACFGYVAPSWSPRKSFAGTYDDAWQKTRAPYLPDDFDLRYFNAAHPWLTGESYLSGGEPVNLMNMSPEGHYRFTLPEWAITTKARIGGKSESLSVNLETVLFEPTDFRFSMIWRTSFACDKKSLHIEQVTMNLDEFKMGNVETYAG